jgi:hypothetical protein
MVTIEYSFGGVCRVTMSQCQASARQDPDGVKKVEEWNWPAAYELRQAEDQFGGSGRRGADEHELRVANRH